MANNGNGDRPEKVLRQSVTQDDVAKYVGNGVVQFLVPAFGGAYLVGPLPPELPAVNSITPYSKARDTILVMTPRVEGFWANALHIAISKVLARGIAFNGPVPRRVETMNELVRWCDGRRGFAAFLERHLLDYFTCSNGAWVEIERVRRSPAAKITSIHHLDSLRVWRTGDPEIPAVYWDLRGGYHELKWWECFNVTDMESARAGFWYSGECASERAYRDIRAMVAMTTYFDEKISGGGYTEIEFVKGVTAQQIEDAKKTATADNLAKGLVYFNGKLIIPVWGDMDIVGHTVKLKGLPDDWKRQEELDIRQLNYANALGIAPVELDPRLVAPRGSGQASQARILDENEQGRGAGAWEKKFLNALNNLVTPTATEAHFVVIDLRDEQQKADIAKTRAETRAAMRGTAQIPGEVTAQQSLYMAIAAEDAPREFLSRNAPAAETLSDDEKPLSEGEPGADKLPQVGQQGAAAGLNRGQTPAALPLPTAKETREPARALLASEMERARALYHQTRHG